MSAVGTTMSYEAQVDIAQILRSTLSLLEQTQYPAKDSVLITDLAAHIRKTIATLEAAKLPPQSEHHEPLLTTSTRTRSG